jgi:ABC-type multidrug transport system fused ATPase/permease subunit
LADNFFALTTGDKIRLAILSIFQFLNSIIEVISLGLIGIFSIAITARITGQEIGLKSQTIFSPISQLFSKDPNSLIFLGSTAVFMLLLKTSVGIYLNKKLNVNLGNITTRVSVEKLEEIAKVKYSWISSQKSAEFSYYLGPGINSNFYGKLLGTYTIIAETIFIITVTLFLAILNPLLTIIIGCLLIVFFLATYKFVINLSKVLNQREVSYLMKNQQFTLELFRAFKELTISNNIKIYQDKMNHHRVSENTIRSKIQWLEQLPKFALELFVVIFGIVIILVSAIPSNAIQGATSLVIFSVALTRLTPSFLRLQTAFVLYEASRYRVKSSSDFFLGLAKNASETPLFKQSDIHFGLPTIEFFNVDFEYERGQKIIDNLSCRFEPGKVNCIVGPSGVGKSTVLELALGLIAPTRGKILVGNVDPSAWRSANPNSAYYLPQETSILEASLYDNIVMNKSSKNPAEYGSVLDIVEKVGLKDVICRHPKGLDAILGSEIKLSGGERQRLGIARALFKETKILVLDEPTSSLDDESEEAIFTIFRDISDQCTMILVTHSQKAFEFFPESLTPLRVRSI